MGVRTRSVPSEDGRLLGDDFKRGLLELQRRRPLDRLSREIRRLLRRKLHDAVGAKLDSQSGAGVHKDEGGLAALELPEHVPQLLVGEAAGEIGN